MPKEWGDLGVTFHPQLQEAIESLNFATTTPVQAAVIPQLLSKKDVVAEAVTGSGKTLAFLVPLLQILKDREREEKWKKHQVGALVISPTRELALQTAEVLQHLLESITGLSQLLLIGGTTVDDDISKFHSGGGNILITTPGRLQDLLQRKTEFATSVKSLEILILDEADRLLDLGFQGTLDVIFSYLPRQRRTGLFSATQTKQVRDLVRAGLRNPVLVSVSAKKEQSTPDLLNNYYIVTTNDGKLATLLGFIGDNEVQKALVFLPTCACVDYWGKVLGRVAGDGFPEVLALHGKMKEKRTKVLDRFKQLSRAVLLCTDVLARGIDIAEVDWVLQWDPPASASAFVHRVGRTARQGRQGSSLILLLETEEAYVHFIQKNQRVKLTKLPDSNRHKPLDLTQQLRHFQVKDRDLMENATRAFVSHIRAYSKHECSLLLRVKELPLGGVASTYGLLKLPKMPELKSKTVDISGFSDLEMDLNLVPYRDKQREQGRKRKLEEYGKTGRWPTKKGKVVHRKDTESWSLAKQRKSDKAEKKLKRKKGKDLKKASGDDVGKKRKKGMSEEEIRELATEYALVKKLKKKKISSEQFDKDFGLG